MRCAQHHHRQHLFGHQLAASTCHDVAMPPLCTAFHKFIKKLINAAGRGSEEH